ncbi:MAG: ankyrin repeat domain-containing protein [Oligoflexia bacterium]|nr:ankyrin repeat domain-containing protein [Oligoflexia bacterium]
MIKKLMVLSVLITSTATLMVGRAIAADDAELLVGDAYLQLEETAEIADVQSLSLAAELVNMLRKGGQGVDAKKLDLLLTGISDPHLLQKIFAEARGGVLHGYENLLEKSLRHGRYDLASVLIRHGFVFDPSSVERMVLEQAAAAQVSAAAPRISPPISSEQALLFKVMIQRLNAPTSAEVNRLLAHLVVNRQLNIINQLLSEKPAKINYHFKDFYGSTLLMHAALLSDVDLLQTLLTVIPTESLPFEVDRKNQHGSSALSWALKSKKPSAKIVSLLLQAGADPNVKYNFNGAGSTNFSIPITPLYQSVRNHQIEIVKALLASGRVDLDQRNRDGNTAIISVAHHNFVDVLELLLEQHPGPNLEIKDINGKTALQISITHKHYPVLKRLLQAGANKRP